MIRRTIIIGAICIAGVFNFAAEPSKKPATQFKEFSFTFDQVNYKTLTAPVFSTSRTVLFKPVAPRKADTRFKNLMQALELHEQEKPIGWDCVFRRSVTARFGNVTAEFGSVTEDFGDVTDGRLVAA